MICVLRLWHCAHYIYRDSDRSHLARLSREASARGPDLVPTHTFPSLGNFPEDGASSKCWGGGLHTLPGGDKRLKDI